MNLLCIEKWAYAVTNQNELALHQKMNFWSAWWKNTFQDFCLKALISINLAQNKYFRTHLDAFIFILNFLPPQMIGIYQNETKLLQGIFLHWYLCCPGQPGVKWLPKQVYLNLKATWVLRCAQQRPSAAQVVPIKTTSDLLRPPGFFIRPPGVFGCQINNLVVKFCFLDQVNIYSHSKTLL